MSRDNRPDNVSPDYQGRRLRQGTTGRGGWDKPNPSDPKANMVGKPNVFEDNSEFMAPLKKKGKVMRK